MAVVKVTEKRYEKERRGQKTYKNKKSLRNVQIRHAWK